MQTSIIKFYPVIEELTQSVWRQIHLEMLLGKGDCLFFSKEGMLITSPALIFTQLFRDGLLSERPRLCQVHPSCHTQKNTVQTATLKHQHDLCRTDSSISPIWAVKNKRKGHKRQRVHVRAWFCITLHPDPSSLGQLQPRSEPYPGLKSK